MRQRTDYGGLPRWPIISIAIGLVALVLGAVKVNRPIAVAGIMFMGRGLVKLAMDS